MQPLFTVRISLIIKIMHKLLFFSILLCFPLLAGAADNGPGYPNIKIGVLSQFHIMHNQTVDFTPVNGAGVYGLTWERQMYLRRMRVLIGGNISERTSFFFETDAPNLGYVNPSGEKNIRLSVFVQDAQIQHVFTDQVGLIAGLQLVGITRNGLQSAASLMAVDYGGYQFFASGHLDNLAGRDLGVNMRGFLFDRRLEYRAGLFGGKNEDRKSPYRFTGRLNYNFFDREMGFFYTGTTLGRGKIVSLGGGIDMQDNYYGVAADAFFDYPVFPFGSLTASVSYVSINSGKPRTGRTDFSGQFPRQNIFFVETGLFIPSLNFQPYLKYEMKDVREDTDDNGVANKLRSGDRIGFGCNYFISAHRMSIKLLYELISGNFPLIASPYYESVKRNQIMLQIQYYTF
jgi:hypothetical protein